MCFSPYKGRDTVKKEGGKMNCVAVGQSMQFTL